VGDRRDTVTMARRRMLFAGATVQALAEAAGPEASAAAAAWLSACTPLWSAVAQAVRLAAQQPPSGGLGAAVTTAVEAADSWAAETGAPQTAFDTTNLLARPCSRLRWLPVPDSCDHAAVSRSASVLTGVDAVGGLLALVMAPATPAPGLGAAALQVLLARGGDLVARLSTAPLISVGHLRSKAPSN
jgi:hypothetical protein